MNSQNKIIVLSGVSIEQTPIISHLIEYYSLSHSIERLEYIYKKRIIFLFKALILVLANPSADLIFIGYQIYPVLVIVSRLRKKIIYWALESNSIDEDNSLVSKIIHLERFINWDNIRIFVPIEDRYNFYRKYKAKSISVFPNVPRIGKSIQLRILDKDCIRLVMYGNLNNNDVYIDEWIQFVKVHKNLDLTLIGRQFSHPYHKIDNLRYIGFLGHKDLIKELASYNFSIIGYRPKNFNTKFCAPNKLYESLSLSLPVILNTNNPTLNNILNNFRCGIGLDFSSINENSFISLNKNLYDEMVKNSFNAYTNSLNFEKYASRLSFI